MTIQGYIYKITNKINHKSYIGKTTYKNPQKRWQQHFSLAKSGDSNYFHTCIREEGSENFECSILEEVQSPNTLEQREKYYIKKYNSLKPNGYNSSNGGEGTHYSELTHDFIELIIKEYQLGASISQLAKKYKMDNKTISNYLIFNGIIEHRSPKEIAISATGKRVALYKEDTLLAVYPSLGEAARHVDPQEQASHISECCRGIRKQIKGYVYKFTNLGLYNSNYVVKLSKEKRETKKKVAMLDKNSSTILKTFDSMMDVGKYFNLNRPQAASTCVARAITRDGTYKGYKWKYLKDLM